PGAAARPRGGGPVRVILIGLLLVEALVLWGWAVAEAGHAAAPPKERSFGGAGTRSGRVAVLEALEAAEDLHDAGAGEAGGAGVAGPLDRVVAGDAGPGVAEGGPAHVGELPARRGCHSGHLGGVAEAARLSGRAGLPHGDVLAVDGPVEEPVAAEAVRAVAGD